MIIRPEKIYVETDVEVNGHTYKRRRIDVLMDFTSEKGCEEMRPGFVCLSPTRVCTYIYSPNAEQMCYFFLAQIC
jgi:hypothetical protein